MKAISVGVLALWWLYVASVPWIYSLPRREPNGG